MAPLQLPAERKVCRNCNMRLLRYCFSFSCFSAAFGMTIFWGYKFWKDEDLCVIDYKTFESSPDVYHPILSVCFTGAVIQSKLEKYNATFTSEKYYEFLYGNKYYDGMEKVDFDDVTLNLTDFYLNDSITFKNGSLLKGAYPNIVNKLPEVTYTGFFYSSQIMKCYGLEVREKKIREGNFGFNSSVFLDGCRPQNGIKPVFICLTKLYCPERP